MKQAKVRQAWEARVAAYRASGQSAAVWCAAHQLTTRQLWYWLRKFSNTKPTVTPSSRWVTVTVDKEPEEKETALIIKVGSAEIEVKPGYNSTLLSSIVKTLQAIC